MQEVLRTNVTLIFLFVLFVLPHIAVAHGLSASYEEVIGEYLVDIGYDPEFPRAGDILLFDFNLFLGETFRTASYKSAWVRLEQDGRTILATGVHRPSFGPMTMLLRPEHAGTLNVRVRFEDEDGVVADTSFPLVITERPQEEGLLERNMVLFLGVLGVIVIGGFGYVLYRARFGVKTTKGYPRAEG